MIIIDHSELTRLCVPCHTNIGIDRYRIRYKLLSLGAHYQLRQQMLSIQLHYCSLVDDSSLMSLPVREESWLRRLSPSTPTRIKISPPGKISAWVSQITPSLVASLWVNSSSLFSGNGFEKRSSRGNRVPKVWAST